MVNHWGVANHCTHYPILDIATEYFSKIEVIYTCLTIGILPFNIDTILFSSNIEGIYKCLTIGILPFRVEKAK